LQKACQLANFHLSMVYHEITAYKAISDPGIPEMTYGIMEWKAFAVGDYMPSE
jgi:hypothetical protein